MDSTKHYGCFSEGSNPSGTTIRVHGVIGNMTVSKTVVIGSSPIGRAILRVGLEVVPARSHKPNDVGSSPTPATTIIRPLNSVG